MLTRRAYSIPIEPAFVHHFQRSSSLTLFFPGFVYFMLYEAQISGERLQDHRSSGFNVAFKGPSPKQTQNRC